jgi:subtilisin-like proprotein convertase family protein
MDANHLSNVASMLTTAVRRPGWPGPFATNAMNEHKKRVLRRSMKGALMRSSWTRVKQHFVLTGLALALVISGAAPLLGDHGVEAGKRAKRTKASGDVQAEEILSFSNTFPLPIAETGTTGGSTIAVSGFETSLADVNVTLHNLSHARSDDIDVLLIGPEGQTAVLVSDIGAANAATNVTLTLDAQAANQLSSVAAPASGTFQPTNFDNVDTWLPTVPSPTQSSGSDLGVFNSTDPNGSWRLFVQDDAGNGSAGSLAGGWSLVITSANGVPNADRDSFQARAGKPLSSSSGVLANDADPDGDFLIAILAGPPRQGSVDLQPDGSFTYKSRKKAKGQDSFTYLAQDPGGLSDLETVTIQIKKARKKGKR